MNRSNMGQQILKAPASALQAAKVAPAMSKGGRAQKPLYERPRPAGPVKTMTPAQKAKASQIAKGSGDKKVGLFARINAMKKVSK